MMLLTKENLRDLPPLYSQDEKGSAALAVVKFFDPCGSWTWYATEGGFVCPDHAMCDCTECPRDTWKEFLFFGLVDGSESELGYFYLSELEKIKRPFGLGIERDRYFTPCTIEKLMQKGKP